MKTSYQYKIKPNKQQVEKIDQTLEKLRYQYNYSKDSGQRVLTSVTSEADYHNNGKKPAS
ncbi:helix-turn-helix domain-containing protein [Nostoc sp.]|uniref:helix-turn-helix domain-containing protein n=1 Tax=Nostoc sp. TaxID=1180 RepID=UPI003FA5CC62